MDWSSAFRTNLSGFNPAVFNPASALGGLGAAAGAAAPAAAAAPALAGAAGGAGGFLGALGGPVGMAATAGLGFLSSGFGNIAAKNQMEGQLRAQVAQDKRDDISNYAFTRAFQRANIGDQMQGLQDMRTGRKMGLGRPEAFQAFLSAGMPAAAARRESFFNV